MRGLADYARGHAKPLGYRAFAGGAADCPDDRALHER